MLNSFRLTEDEIHRMIVLLQELCKDTEADPQAVYESGDPCLAQFSDQYWYRAVVQVSSYSIPDDSRVSVRMSYVIF